MAPSEGPTRQARPKRRVRNHLHGECGVTVVKRALPQHWVIREISPDYGLDLHIETFTKVPDDETVWDALGEHFFAQVKTVDGVKISEIPPHREVNPKTLDLVPAELEEDFEAMRVISFPLEVDEIETVRQMGSAVPVLLLVVDKKTQTAYYICLNDWIAKVLPGFRSDWRNQKTVVVHIPAANILSNEGEGWNYLSLLARRPKFYGAFVEFGKYQEEMNWAAQRIDLAVDLYDGRVKDLTVEVRDYKRLFSYYYFELVDLDIWPTVENPSLEIMNSFSDQLEKVKSALDGVPDDWSDSESRDENYKRMFDAMSLVRMFFMSIAGFPQTYGLMTRNWNIPTQLGEHIRATNGK